MNIAFLVLSKYQNNNYKDIFLEKYYLNTDDGKLTHINNFEKIYGAYWKLPRNVSQNYLGLHDDGNGTMKIKYIANSDIGVNEHQNSLIGNTQKMIGEQK